MLKTKRTKKNLLILLAVLLLFLLINIIGAKLIQKKIASLLLKSKTEYYTATVEDVDFFFIRKTLILENVFLIPSKESVANLMDASSKKNKVENITLSSIELSGFNYLSLLFNNTIKLDAITLNDLNLHTFENSKIHAKKEKKTPFDIDSIFIKDLNGLTIKNINVNNFKFQVFDFATNEMSFETKPLSFKSSGIILEQYKEHTFKLKPAQKKFKIDNIYLNLDELKYHFSLGSILFNFDESLISLQNLAFKPQIDKYKLASTYTYNDDIYDLKLDRLNVYNFDLKMLLKGKGLLIDSISIANLDLTLFKDKTKPFNEQKRPGLPHTGLKNMEFPLSVAKVKISNSNVLIQEKMKDKDLLMEVPINNLNAEITNITSIDSLRQHPLKASIDAELMGSCKTNVEATFPLKDHQNTFYFSGTLGASKLRLFDTALFPVLGLKVLEGELDGLTFNARANPFESHGEMTMLYHDLEADVFKNKSTEENHFLSWTVNSLIHNSNPKKNKAPRVAAMHFERVTYKGLGNYFWKTLQNGLINTIAPGGKHVKKDKKKK